MIFPAWALLFPPAFWPAPTSWLGHERTSKTNRTILSKRYEKIPWFESFDSNKSEVERFEKTLETVAAIERGHSRKVDASFSELSRNILNPIVSGKRSILVYRFRVL